MSEPSNAQLGTSAPPRDSSPAAVERLVSGMALRVDGPHPMMQDPPAEDAAGARQRAFPARDVPLDPPSGIDVRLVSPLHSASADAESGYDRFAVETGQIAAHLRQQYADLDRREQRLHAQLAQVDQERREQRMWTADLEAGLEEREFSIARLEAALAQRADACLKLETELKELHEALLRERHSLNLERDQLTHDREDQTKELEALKARQHHELERLRADLISEHDEAETRLKQERVLVDNRHRFQHDHLERTMREFESVQDEFRREQQLLRTRHEETQAQVLLRSRQLDRQRELLDERQQSIEREREVLLKERRAMEERLSAEADELRNDRAAWESERDSQKADLRRQQDMLALHAENLETRRQRLDRLRAELEETNRQTLELRLAVEESLAQLTQTAGADVTKRRIDEARAILAEYYRHTRESLIQQRQELEQAQMRVHTQRDEFRAERQMLVEWVAAQEEQLAGREQNLRREGEAIDEREAGWRAAAERWTNEKLEAETIIRDLLKQLAEREER
jgi:hypothetical protein